jgi:hypothetical protein
VPFQIILLGGREGQIGIPLRIFASVTKKILLIKVLFQPDKEGSIRSETFASLWGIETGE